MRTAIKHPVPDRVKSSFVFFDTWALWRWALSVRVPGCQKLRLNPVWHRMLYSCTHMATACVKGLQHHLLLVLSNERRVKKAANAEASSNKPVHQCFLTWTYSHCAGSHTWAAFALRVIIASYTIALLIDWCIPMIAYAAEQARQAIAHLRKNQI